MATAAAGLDEMSVEAKAAEIALLRKQAAEANIKLAAASQQQAALLDVSLEVEPAPAEPPASPDAPAAARAAAAAAEAPAAAEPAASGETTPGVRVSETSWADVNSSWRSGARALGLALGLVLGRAISSGFRLHSRYWIPYLDPVLGLL